MLRYGNVYTVIVNSAVDCGQHVAIDSLHYIGTSHNSANICILRFAYLQTHGVHLFPI